MGGALDGQKMTLKYFSFFFLERDKFLYFCFFNYAWVFHGSSLSKSTANKIFQSTESCSYLDSHKAGFVHFICEVSQQQKGLLLYLTPNCQLWFQDEGLKNAIQQLELSVRATEINIICPPQQGHLLRNHSSSESQGENTASCSAFTWQISPQIAASLWEVQMSCAVCVCLCLYLGRVRPVLLSTEPCPQRFITTDFSCWN